MDAGSSTGAVPGRSSIGKKQAADGFAVCDLRLFFSLAGI